MSEVPAEYVCSVPIVPGQRFFEHRFVFNNRDEVGKDMARLVKHVEKLERELRETREALLAAERRENDLLDRMRGEGGL